LNSQCLRMPSDDLFAAELYKYENLVNCFQGVTRVVLQSVTDLSEAAGSFKRGPNMYLQNLGNGLSDCTTPRKAVRFIAHCCENTQSRLSVSVNDHN
jgi:hypothetical protein